jgi:hypothetical protein
MQGFKELAESGCAYLLIVLVLDRCLRAKAIAGPTPFTLFPQIGRFMPVMVRDRER